jgi:MoxR-like ATPase
MSQTLEDLNQNVQQASSWIRTLRNEIGHVIVGQQYLVDRLLVGLLANGHVLLEGVPGLAKTLSARVLAAENPIDQEGTYPLPEAQVDRFMLKVLVDYPAFEEERRILDTMAFTAPEMKVQPIISLDEIVRTRKIVDHIHVHEQVRDYIVRIVFATRQPEQYQLSMKHLIQFGASPRATIMLTLAAKAWAVLQGRGYVTPQDVKSIGPDVLRHRMILSYEAEAEGVTSDELIKKILDTIPVP